MEQIQEAYVSFETAKLLKEKGFDEKCFTYFDKNGVAYVFTTGGVAERVNNTELDIYSPRIIQPECVRPTQQMVMAWLRLKYNLSIEPYRTACGYLYIISNIPYGTTLYSDHYNGDDEYCGQWTKWELACEAGIKYCLENLVK